jgi:hypothetical protein
MAMGAVFLVFWFMSRPAPSWGLWANRHSPIAAALLLVSGSGVALALVSGVETQRLVLLLFQNCNGQ